MASKLTLASGLLIVVAASLLTSPPVRGGGPAAAPVLDDASFEKWRGFIHPSKEELAFELIEWHPTLWSGLTRAQEDKKPLMIWIMNGHPCGTT